MTLLLVIHAMVATPESPLLCGVATNQFSSNPATLTTAMSTGKLSFWWNWATAPKIDEKAASAAASVAANQTFIPMLWCARIAFYFWSPITC